MGGLSYHMDSGDELWEEFLDRLEELVETQPSAFRAPVRCTRDNPPPYSAQSLTSMGTPQPWMDD